MFEMLVWTFAAIGLAFAGYHALRFTAASLARCWACGNRTRRITITRIVAPQEMIDLAQQLADGPDDALARLLEANPYFAIAGTLRRNSGLSEPYERECAAFGGCLEYPSTLDVLRALAGDKAYLPAVDFRPAMVEVMSVEEAQVAA
jgi:hypothetical protein